MFQSPLLWLIIVSTVTLYWIVPSRFRLGLLGVVSFGYVYYLTSVSAIALMTWFLIFYFMTPLIGPGRKNGVVIATTLILFVLGFLCYFKYLPPITDAIFKGSDAGKVLAPIGISYYSFKLIHYAIEVRRGTLTERSLPAFLSYLFLFPMFTAGPIERYDHYLKNIDTTFTKTNLVEGVSRIMHGFIKKFVIAEILMKKFFGSMDSTIFLQQFSQMSTLELWGYLLVMNFYLYMDFSAYSDLAIGTSRLFGIRIMENFNFPVLAHNLQEFWRRWHMSLSGWCQSYIHLPVMGLTRNPHLALYATFIGMGLWHAGTLSRIGWGVYHATGITLYMSWVRFRKKKRWKPPQAGSWMSLPGIAFTYVYVSGSMIFLIAGDETFSITRTIKILLKALFIDIS